MQATNIFLKEKLKEIKMASNDHHVDMFELIGSVRDIFSSAYLTKPIADPEIIQEMWGVLSTIFIHNENYDNKFDSIMAMSYVYLYAKNQNISLCLDELRKWRKKAQASSISSEVLECVDDILIG